MSVPMRLQQLTMSNKLARACWYVVYWLAFRLTPTPLHAWRAFVLRCFGARIGTRVRVYASAKIWAPWNLVCEDVVTIANGAVVYNPLPIRLGSHCVISQDAYLCGATHDFEDPAFPMVSSPITVGRYAWVCARAVVGPGVNVADGAVLGLASVTMRDLEAWTVYAGAPARPLRKRVWK